MGLIQKPEDFGMLVFTVLYYAFTMIRLKTNPTTDYNHSGPDIIGFRAKGQELLGGPQSRDRGFCASLWRGGLASYLLPVAQAQTLNLFMFLGWYIATSIEVGLWGILYLP